MDKSTNIAVTTVSVLGAYDIVNYKNVESRNIATTTIMPRIQFISLAFREGFPSLNIQPTAQISNTPTNINIRCPIYRLYIQQIELANSLNTAILVLYPASSLQPQIHISA